MRPFRFGTGFPALSNAFQSVLRWIGPRSREPVHMENVQPDSQDCPASRPSPGRTTLSDQFDPSPGRITRPNCEPGHLSE